jgi:hypothetical protein
MEDTNIMTTPSVLQQPTPHQLVNRVGGGCLAGCFVPFLLAGITVILLSLGIIPSDARDDAGRATAGAIGWVFALLSAVIIFWRRRTMLDTSTGRATKQWLFGAVPFWTAEYALHAFTHVELRYAKDTFIFNRHRHFVYWVVLTSENGTADFAVATDPTYEDARAAAMDVATFLQLPLTDRTLPNQPALPPGTLDLPVILQANEGESDIPDVPSIMCSRLESTATGLRIDIPPTGFLLMSTLRAIGPLIIFVLFLRGFLTALRAPFSPALVFFGVCCLLVLVIVRRVVSDSVQSQWSRTTVAADPAGITLEHRIAGMSRSTFYPAADIRGVEVITAQEGLGAQMSPPQTASEQSQTITRIMGIPMSGLVIRTPQQLVRVGHTLPDEELHYLKTRIIGALKGK